MNDDELLTAVRDSFTGVHSATPVEQIVSRSRAVRARRRIPGMAGALALVAGAAIVVTTLLSGHQLSPATAQLAAWTVTKQANGSISVAIRELRDPAGLQRTLRADGVPASVTFSGQPNPACQPYPYLPGKDRSQAVRKQTMIQVTPNAGRSYVMVVRPAVPPATGLLIDPSAVPRRVGLEIEAGPVRHRLLPVWASLVQASHQCTGS
jgi:hypothetical protein